MHADYGVPQRRKRVIIVGLKGEETFEFPQATHYESGDGLKKYVSVEEALGDLPKAIQDENGRTKYTCEPKNDYQERMRADKKSDVTEHFVSRLSELDKYIISHVKPGGNYMDIPADVNSERNQKTSKGMEGILHVMGRLLPEKPSYTINTYFNRPNVAVIFITRMTD